MASRIQTVSCPNLPALQSGVDGVTDSDGVLSKPPCLAVWRGWCHGFRRCPVQTSLPCSLAWMVSQIQTVSSPNLPALQSGVGNVSPYSYFSVLAHDPPMLAVGHCWAHGRPKDSLANILATR